MAIASSPSSSRSSKLWEDVLGDEFLTRPRLSRIYYDGKYFDYPLAREGRRRPPRRLESARCALSYLSGPAARARARPRRSRSGSTQRFGKRLYDAFFRTYTQKVWGIPGSEIRALWAAQRIKNFSLFQAVLTILGLRRGQVTTLIEEFRYPRLGPGQMWEAIAATVEERGDPGEAQPSRESIRHRDGLVDACRRRDGDAERWLRRRRPHELAARRPHRVPRPGAARARRSRRRGGSAIATSASSR